MEVLRLTVVVVVAADEAPEVVVAVEVVGLTVVVVAVDEAPEVVLGLEVVGLTVVVAGPSATMTAEPAAATPKMTPRPTTAALSFFIG